MLFRPVSLYWPILIILMVSACSSLPSVERDGVSPATPDPELPLPLPDQSKDLIPTQSSQAVEMPDARRLINLSPIDVQKLIGAPDLVRRDGPVQIALYEPGPCVLDLYYYSEKVGLGFSLISLRARDSKGQDVREDDCLLSILADRPVPDSLRSDDNAVRQSDQAKSDDQAENPKKETAG